MKLESLTEYAKFTRDKFTKSLGEEHWSDKTKTLAISLLDTYDQLVYIQERRESKNNTPSIAGHTPVITGKDHQGFVCFEVGCVKSNEVELNMLIRDVEDWKKRDVDISLKIQGAEVSFEDLLKLRIWINESKNS